MPVLVSHDLDQMPCNSEALHADGQVDILFFTSIFTSVSKHRYFKRGYTVSDALQHYNVCANITTVAFIITTQMDRSMAWMEKSRH